MGANNSKQEEKEELKINEEILNEKQSIFFALSRIRHQSKNDIFLAFRRLYKRGDPQYIDRKKCYALKVIELNENYNENDFEREQNILDLLKPYPYFIQYENPFKITIKSKDYIIVPMKYYYQTDLYNYMTRRGFKYDEYFVCSIAYQSLNILRILKERRIVHNDIKLHNFIIESENPFKFILTDFEGSQILSKDEKSDIFACTFIFAAPEVLKYKMHDFSSDIWSLGVNIYFILFGSFPFNIKPNDSKEEILSKIENNDLEKLNENISDEAFEFLSQILVINEKERISVENALKMDWFRDMYEVDTKVATKMCTDDKIDVDDKITDA